MITGNPVIIPGGGTVSKPSYLISDGNTVTTFCFNTEYRLQSFLSALSYPDTDPSTGLDVCALGLGYFYAVDLTSGNYALVWNDGTNIVPVYSTTAVPSFGVTSAGWQIPSYTPSSSVTVAMSGVISVFKAVMDQVVAKSAIAFGTKSEALSVSENGTYSAPGGTLYNSVSVSVSGGGSKPQLNAPSISFTSMNLKITDPSTNGNFTTGFKVFVNGAETYTVSRTGTTTTYDMSGCSENTASVTVKTVGTNFEDSAASSAATFYKYFTVRFYDDDETTLLSTKSIAYGSSPSYTPTKARYTFVRWEDANGNTVTTITSDIDLYAVWQEGLYIAAGTYAVRSGLSQNSYTTMDIPINFTWKRKVGSAGSAMTGTVLYYKTYYSTPTVWCSKTTSDLSNRLMTWGSTTGWNPSSFIYEEDGHYKIVVSSDTNVTQDQKTQFEYFFERLES